MSDLPEVLKRGEQARLFPVLADTSKEGRALSVLLACLANVEDLGRTMLSTIGQRVGVRSRISTYTEVTLANATEGDTGRPDGMILVKSGRRYWTALVEAKVRRSRLEEDQVGTYLKLAKANGVDAVVTISNDFAAVPHHHPIRVARLPKGVDLFHWSWTSILTHSKVLLAAKSVDDAEQRFLLSELVKFLDHPSTGVMRFDRMVGSWKEMVTSVIAGVRLHKTSDAVTDVVASWHQECRDLALVLSELVNANVITRLPKAHGADPRRRIADEAESLCSNSKLQVEFYVPDSAAPIRVEADLPTRSIHVSMTLRAPEDRKSTRARTNWLLRQIAASDPSHLHVKALWPRRRVPTQETLEVAREDPDALGGPNRGLSPRAFEVRFVRDAGARFVGAKTFIDELEASVLQFYAEVGQRLKQWQPAPPRIVAKETSTESREGASDGAAGTDQEARGLADGEGAGLLERGQC